MIRIYSEREFTRIRKACAIIPRALEMVRPSVQPGITTAELNQIVDSFIRAQGAVPSFIGVPGPGGVPPFPSCCCISVNEEVVHGVPGERVLKDGDIVSLDMGTILDGYYGDSAFTFPVGRISPERQALLDATQEALRLGIQAARPGNRVSDIGHAIEEYIRPLGYGIVREMVGHGCGSSLHEAPEIPNYGPAGKGPKLRPGMCLCIEPMINAGDWRIDVLEDGWTVVSADGSDSAHFEHQIRITSAEAEILTALD